MFTAVFNLVILLYFGFALLHASVINTTSHHLPTHIFLCQVHVFASSSHWFIGKSMCTVIGQSNGFDFGLTILN